MDSYHGYSTLDIQPGRLIGRPGLGFYRLGFIPRFVLQGKRIGTDSPHPASYVRDIKAEIYVRNKSQPGYLLGIACPESPLVLMLQPNKYEVSPLFYLELDRVRLEAIERLRGGGDLWFRARWFGVVEGIHGPVSLQDPGHIELHANQSTWLAALHEMEYRASMLFEIPIPDDSDHPALKEAIGYLRAAEQDHRIGHSDDAIGDCRKALEALSKAVFEAEDVRKARQMYLRNPKDSGAGEEGGSRENMTIDQRFFAVYEALRHVTNLAPHAPPAGPDYRFARKDAAVVIAITSVLISRFYSI